MSDLFRKLFDEMPCYVTAQDRQLRIIAANRFFRRDFADAIGAHCYEVYKKRSEKCPICTVERTFQDGQVHHSEEIVTRKNGDEIDVILYTSPIRDANGEITAVVKASTDITRVKELQRKFYTLFDEVPCYISVQDRNLKIIEANRRFKKDFGEGIGDYCYSRYKHRKEPCMVCPVAETFHDGKVHRSEEVVTASDGTQVNVLVHSTALRNTAGEIASVMEMSTNITELRQLQSQLTSLGLIVGSVSHSLKGLLSGLDGGIYLMDTGFKKDNKKRVDQGWDMVRRSVDGIRNMVLNVLFYAKEREVFWQPIDLEEVTNAVREALQRRAEIFGVKLNIEAGSGSFDGDNHSIRSMLVNLVENSLDACRLDKKDGERQVDVSASVDEDRVVFDIADNGIGMDQETKEKAFSLFFSSKGAEGTGLGLFIAHKIVKQHHGTINIESTLGTGTRFLVTLPRQKPSDAQNGGDNAEEERG